MWQRRTVTAPYRVEMNQPARTALPTTMKFALQHTKRRKFVNNSSAVAQIGERLATWAEKRGSAVPLSVGDRPNSSHLTQCRLGRGYLHTKWHLDPSNRLAKYTNVTDTQDRQRHRSIGRTVTCNGRPKTALIFTTSD